jgi:hypothetical protein
MTGRRQIKGEIGDGAPDVVAGLQIERVAIASLTLDPKNARLHPERNIAAIEASLARFGQRKPIVVDKDGVILAGNGTVEAARRLGWSEIDVVRTDLAGTEARAYALADNRTAELAEWDLSVLKSTLETFDDQTLDEIGFSDDMLADLVSEYEEKELKQVYSSKVDSPIYTPKRETPPSISELFDRSKTHSLIEKIENSHLPHDVSAFLRFAAERHTVFHFANIAEFYAHADKNVQRLMEDSGLVIVDYKKAIENGFVSIISTVRHLADIELDQVDDAQ